MKRKYRTLIALTLSIIFAIYAYSAAYAAGEIDKELKSEIKSSIDRGLRWLREQQEDDGSYAHHPGITALVTTAFMRSPRQYTEEDGPFMKKAMKYLTSLAKPDGSIYDKDMPNYNTSVALMALSEAKNPAYDETIKRAQNYLMVLQADEGSILWRIADHMLHIRT